MVVNSGLSSSFMGTIGDQIERTYTRDFTVQAAGATLATGGGSGVPNGLAEQIAAMPETRAATPIRALLLDMPGVEAGGPQGLALGYDPEVYGLMDGTPMVGTTREEALRGVAAGGLIAGAQYARVAGLELGDRVRLAGPRGTHEAPVVGIRDGMSSSGVMELQVSLDTIRRVYGVTTDAQVAVRARSDEQAAALGRRIDALVAARYPGLELASLADEREAQEKQVSATFNMFNSIVAIAVIVSLLGVVNTLAMSVLERTREIGVLRALGSSRWQVRRTMLDESLLITSAGAFAGIGFGLVIALVLDARVRGDDARPDLPLPRRDRLRGRRRRDRPRNRRRRPAGSAGRTAEGHRGARLRVARPKGVAMSTNGAAPGPRRRPSSSARWACGWRPRSWSAT